MSLWNCRGFKEPSQWLSDIPDALDIILLSETWQETGSTLPDFPGYHTISLPRPYRHERGRRASGGIAAFISAALFPHVSVHHTDALRGIMWLRITDIHDAPDLYICLVYMPPEHSTAHSMHADHSVIEALRDTTASVQASHGHVVTARDLNARTATLPDHDDFSHLPTCVQDLSCTTSTRLEEPRANKDGHTNNYGRTLLDLCKQADLAILNGCAPGDPTGTVMCRTPKGSSTVDHFIASHQMLHQALNLTVHDLIPGSDHCPVQLRLVIGEVAAAITQPHTLAPPKFR